MADLWRKVQDLFKTSPISSRSEKRRDLSWRWEQQEDTSYAPVVALAVNDGEGLGRQPPEQGLPTDPATGALAIISTLHAFVHVGRAYITTKYVSSVANNATIDFLIRTGSTVAHVTWVGACTGNCLIEAYEAPTVGAAGTPVPVQALNRITSVIPLVSINHTPTIAPGNEGTLLATFLYPGGRGGNASGEIGRPDSEFIFARSTEYLLRLTNISGIPAGASNALIWYEVA